MEAYLGTIILWPSNFAPTDWAICNGQQLSITQYQALFSLIGTTWGGNGTTTFNLPNFNNQFLIGTPTNGIPGATGGAQVSTGPFMPTSIQAQVQFNGSLNFTAPALTVNTMPAHSHTAQLVANPSSQGAISVAIPVNSTGSANLTNPNGNVLGVSNDGSSLGNIVLYNNAATGSATLAQFNATLNVTGGNGTVTNQNTGQGSPAQPTAAPSSNTAVINLPVAPFLTMSYIICVNGLYPVFP